MDYFVFFKNRPKSSQLIDSILFETQNKMSNRNELPKKNTFSNGFWVTSYPENDVLMKSCKFNN